MGEKKPISLRHLFTEKLEEIDMMIKLYEHDISVVKSLMKDVRKERKDFLREIANAQYKAVMDSLDENKFPKEKKDGYYTYEEIKIAFDERLKEAIRDGQTFVSYVMNGSGDWVFTLFIKLPKKVKFQGEEYYMDEHLEYSLNQYAPKSSLSLAELKRNDILEGLAQAVEENNEEFQNKMKKYDGKLSDLQQIMLDNIHLRGIVSQNIEYIFESKLEPYEVFRGEEC